MGAASPTKGTLKMKWSLQTVRSDFFSPKQPLKLQTRVWKRPPEFTPLSASSVCHILGHLHNHPWQNIGTLLQLLDLLEFYLQIKAGQMNLSLGENNSQAHLIANPARWLYLWLTLAPQLNKSILLSYFLFSGVLYHCLFPRESRTRFDGNERDSLPRNFSKSSGLGRST